MHEDLLGYLLGALEPHEMRRVAQWLKEDPEARERLAEVERSLKPLEDSFEPIEQPPIDLVSRTLDCLPPLPSPMEVGPTPDSVLGLAPMQEIVEPPRNVTLTWMDWAGGAAVAAVFLALLLPSMAQGRFEARKVACQDQLRQFGTALTQFVNRSEQARLPAVAEAGPEAFAGVYAVRLHDAGLMDDTTIRWCPSLDQPSRDSTITTTEVATVDRLHESSVDDLREIQRVVGGHYAYTLGVIDEDRFSSPRFESRSSFAVMSDAPLTSAANDLSTPVGHSGMGINVLYEDGRVQFISLSSLGSMPDHPLQNHRGKVEAGVNIDDASLAPSWRPPFVSVRQR